MSRALRIDYPNAWHHVMNRARRGTELFIEKADYQLFIDLLKEVADLFTVNIAAFCLMPNHYHIMVQTPNANLSRCMRHLNGVYTQKYNIVHRCDGTLFRGRNKSILVDDDSYVLQRVTYTLLSLPKSVLPRYIPSSLTQTVSILFHRLKKSRIKRIFRFHNAPRND